MITKEQIEKAFSDINVSFAQLDETIKQANPIFENRLDDLYKAKRDLTTRIKKLSNLPEDPFLESPELNELEEKRSFVDNEIWNLEDIISDLSETDTSPLIWYSDVNLETNDDTLRELIKN